MCLLKLGGDACHVFIKAWNILNPGQMTPSPIRHGQTFKYSWHHVMTKERGVAGMSVQCLVKVLYERERMERTHKP